MPKLSSVLNRSPNILSAWTALEVLAPQTFKRPEELVRNGDKKSIAFVMRQGLPLPWENKVEKLKEGKQLFYKIVVGTIDFKAAVSALYNKYKTPENSYYEDTIAAEGEAIIASIILDQQGRLIEEDAVIISSFAWGLDKALSDSLESLADWASEEERLTAELDGFFRRTDEHNQNPPITKEMLWAGLSKLIHMLKIPEALIRGETLFSIRAEQDKTSTPRHVMLNSFYLKDLIAARKCAKNNALPKNLGRYLRGAFRSGRINLLDLANRELKRAVSPKFIPPGRWPGPGRHPLALLQQAAVNLAFSNMQNGGMLGVNGPPGTGKTTLLRDIVAGIITQRAEIMCEFKDPCDAFKPLGQVQADKGTGRAWGIHALDKRLKGHEILIASSNNKAVENISAELPSAHAVGTSTQELSYFKLLSDKMLEAETWGLISGVLGNSGNRHEFVKTFWFDNDYSLKQYLGAIVGKRTLISTTDDLGNEIEREPYIVQHGDPPSTHAEAMSRWDKARKEFLNVLKKSKDNLAELEDIQKLAKNLEDSAQFKPPRVQSKPEPKTDFKIIVCITVVASFIMGLGKGLLIGLAAWLFFEHSKVKRLVRQLHESRTRNDSALHKIYDRRTRLTAIREKVEAYKTQLGSHFIDRDTFKKEHEELHQISPWCDSKTQTVRDNVFISAIKLHKAFIDAAAAPIRSTIAAFMQNFSQSNMTNSEKLKFMPELWASFFLVVPSVSTTFASVERMLGNLPHETLGWLLIDEAGQAIPQAAVGAIMRTKRALVVGDPKQIEPVVMLPRDLTQKICKKFKVSPEDFSAPEASAQTLADAASKYGTKSVGVPLLVHRRCTNPMFTISNKIAYEGLMIMAKKPGSSRIRDCLGDTAWIDIQSQASDDKWSQAEGEKAVELLKCLKANSICPDLYIISPFRVVANSLAQFIKRSNVLEDWIKPGADEWIRERVGTVHTAQGREAEAVIFVLGAPMSDQYGARKWAGSTPNLLNVAVTRAKEVLYVIGNRSLWRSAGVFSDLCDRVKEHKTEIHKEMA